MKQSIFRNIFSAFLVSAMTGLGCFAAMAAELPKPTGEVILTVDGAVTITNVDGKADFDLATLEALPRSTIDTNTPWTDGVTHFEGVLLSDLLKATGATGSQIAASALNDYAVTLPVQDELGAMPLVAFKINGDYIPVRGKGPLWVVYPYDSNRRLNTETYFIRSIWQLRQMRIEP